MLSSASPFHACIADANESARSKFLAWQRWATLRGLFELLGRCIGAYPLVFICASFLVALSSTGMTRMVLKDRIRDGYTPNNAPSRYETDVIREFWNSTGTRHPSHTSSSHFSRYCQEPRVVGRGLNGSAASQANIQTSKKCYTTGDPMMTLVLLLAKDGGSMVRKAQLDEAERLVNFLHKNFTIDYKGKPMTFSQLCHPYCNLNMVFQLFKVNAFFMVQQRCIKRRLLRGRCVSRASQVETARASRDIFPFMVLS